MMDAPLRILFRLTGGFGFGDTAQFSIILKHLAKHRPHWTVSVKSPRGAHSALHGLCHQSLHNDEPEGQYDKVVDLQLDNSVGRYTDRPSNKTTYILPRVFGIEYDASLGRYECRVTAPVQRRTEAYLRRIDCPERSGLYGAVLLHYEGSTSMSQKNLHEWQADAICHATLAAGRVPIILDWHKRSSLPDQKRIFCPGCDDPLWQGLNNGDAETIAALIRSCEAFIGVDSGPGKVASSTSTPSLICWTKHSPLNFHDPADNTTHLIPEGWRQAGPVCGDEAMAAYFDSAYRWRPYSGDHGMVAGVLRWLAYALKLDSAVDLGVRFVVPNDARAVQWCIAKMRGIACGRPIEVIVSGDHRQGEGAEALETLRQYDWIKKVSIQNIPVHLGPEKPRNSRGHYLYVSEGMRGGYHFLVPNITFESGGTIERWMPDVPVEETCSLSTV